MIENFSAKKIIIVGTIATISAFALLLVFRIHVSETPPGMLEVYQRVKIAELSGKISGLGESDIIAILIEPVRKHPSIKYIKQDCEGWNGEWHCDFSPIFKSGGILENLKIIVYPKFVPKGLKPVPTRYRFSITRGEKIEDVNFKFVKR